MPLNSSAGGTSSPRASLKIVARVGLRSPDCGRKTGGADSAQPVTETGKTRDKVAAELGGEVV